MTRRSRYQGKILSRTFVPPFFTPAMAAKVTKRLWEMSDVVDMLEAWEISQ